MNIFWNILREDQAMQWNWIKIEVGLFCVGWWAAVGLTFLRWEAFPLLLILPVAMVLRILHHVRALAPPR